MALTASEYRGTVIPGFVTDVNGALVTVSAGDGTPLGQVIPGSLTDADGRLVVSTTLTPIFWGTVIPGFATNAAGALLVVAAGDGTPFGAVTPGFLTDSSGRLVTGSGVARVQGGFARTSGGGLATVSGGGAALTDVAFFGDSFTAGGANGDSLAVRYSTQTCGRLSVTEHNFGASGARQNLNRPVGPDILTQVYQAVEPPSSAPYAPLSSWQAAVIQASINNLNLNAVHADLSIVTSALLRGIHRIRSAGCYEAYGAGRFTYPSGSWSDVPTVDANSGAGIKRASSAGATWSLAVPADFPGGTLRVYGPKAISFGGLETFTKDAGADGTLDNRNAALQSGSQSWEHPTTLTAGAHTIAGTISPIASVENLNGADFEIATRPVVIVLNTAKSPNYPGGEYTILDADVTASNSAVSSAVSGAFPGDARVVVVDIDTVLGKNPANFGADGIHPNATGGGLMATAIAAAITTAVAAP